MVRIIDKIIQRRKQSVTHQYDVELSNENDTTESLNNGIVEQINDPSSTSATSSSTTTSATTTSASAINHKNNNHIKNLDWYYSFEFFPPKTEAGLDNLLTRIDRMVQRMDPLFIDITWSTYEMCNHTMAIATHVQKLLSVDVLLHLSTVNMSREQILYILQHAKSSGIQNILVLRGDPPRGKQSWLPNDISNGYCSRAIDLVKLIRQEYGHYFCIAVAGHPEGHPSSISPHDEMLHLYDKVHVAGADFIITQLFYDVTVFHKYVKECRKYNITCPIIPGIMPIQSYSSFTRMIQYCNISVPQFIWDQLEPYKNDDEAIKRIGCDIATNMCRQILSFKASSGGGGGGGDDDSNVDMMVVDGIHFYTLNLERSVTYILNQLGAIDIVQPTTSVGASNINTEDDTTTSTNIISTTTATPTTTTGTTTIRANTNRTLPWRPSAMERRYKYEQVRPINWANRPKSYVVRTEDWDEYPNGRWGDATSPAFGELSDVGHFYSFSLGSDEDQRAMLGDHPKTPSDVYEVFAKYVEGLIPHIPWCETSLQPESFTIQKQLSQLNRFGFLTINSQPSVNGVSSSHKTFGWGGSGGYVYQKAYCECFCSPENTQKLVTMVKQHKSMNLYAINTNGNEIQEGVELGGVTALTWGVFPNREILQPTIFDPGTFIVWSEEAFSLWTYMWLNLYEYDSTSYTLIETIRDTYYLCAIIDNDYISTSTTIWDAMQVAGNDELSSSLMS